MDMNIPRAVLNDVGLFVYFLFFLIKLRGHGELTPKKRGLEIIFLGRENVESANECYASCGFKQSNPIFIPLCESLHE